MPKSIVKFVIWDLLHFFYPRSPRRSRTKQQTNDHDGRYVWNSHGTVCRGRERGGGKRERERDRPISVFDEIGICSTFHVPSMDVYSTYVTVHQKFNMRCMLERMFCWYTHACARMCCINHCAHILFSNPEFFVLSSYLKDVANYYCSGRLLILIKIGINFCMIKDVFNKVLSYRDLFYSFVRVSKL